MCDSQAWSLIVDTTPDITSKEQLSICIRIVSKDGNVSEHILECEEAERTTASALFEVIVKVFESKGISCQKIVAQTYDGASNMNGRYKGLQAIVKEKFGKHILYIHCYAHTLNLVLKDTVAVNINVATLFNSLEELHNLFNHCHKIHKLYEKVQSNANVQITTVKRLNTVRWSLPEDCLKVINKRLDIIMDVLKILIISTDQSHCVFARHSNEKRSSQPLVFLQRCLG